MRCQHCSTRFASQPRDLCRTCWNDKGVRFAYPLREGRRKYGHNPGEKPSDPDYLEQGLSLEQKLAAVFLYWPAWREDYDVERALRADLTAVLLREYKVAERATVAVRLMIDARR